MFVVGFCLVISLLLILLINFLFRKKKFFVTYRKLINLLMIIIFGFFSWCAVFCVSDSDDYTPGPFDQPETLTTACKEILVDKSIQHFFEENNIQVDKCRKTIGRYMYMNRKTYSEFSGVINTKNLEHIITKNKIVGDDRVNVKYDILNFENTRRDSFNHITYGDMFNSVFNQLKENISKEPVKHREVVWTNFYNLIPGKVVRMLYEENIKDKQESPVFITIINTTQRIPPEIISVN